MQQRRQKAPVAARKALDRQALAETLLEGQSVEVLQALGLVTARGGANADAHRKIKQNTHFVRLIEPALQAIFDRYPEPVLFDAAAGKSYLAFVIYERWIARLGRGRMIVCEQRADLAEQVRGIAEKLGYAPRFEVQQRRIIEAELPERVHFTLALHACDTATDEALAQALRHGSDHVALVPCCQAEVARQLQSIKAGPQMLWQHAWHRREFGAHLTNVLRGLVLQSLGYQVTVTELAGWQHSLKNELILGRKVARYQRAALDTLGELLAQIPVRPWLFDVLAEEGLLTQQADGRWMGGGPAQVPAQTTDEGAQGEIAAEGDAPEGRAGDRGGRPDHPRCGASGRSAQIEAVDLQLVEQRVAAGLVGLRPAAQMVVDEQLVAIDRDDLFAHRELRLLDGRAQRGERLGLAVESRAHRAVLAPVDEVALQIVQRDQHGEHEHGGADGLHIVMRAHGDADARHHPEGRGAGEAGDHPARL